MRARTVHVTTTAISNRHGGMLDFVVGQKEQCYTSKEKAALVAVESFL
jgi:hypothetical protein